MGRTPVMVHEYGDHAEVEFYNGDVVQDVPMCSHFLSGEAHTNPKAIQMELNRRRRAALKAEGKTDDRGVRDPEEGYMENDKYVVFKKEEYDEPLRDAEPLQDAVVIRLQDVFAGPGLHAYANAIQTGLDLDMLADECGISDEDRTRLEDIRDYFFSMAIIAKDRDQKLPD